MRPILKAMALAVATLSPAALRAEDAALIVAEVQYDTLPAAAAAEGFDALALALDAAGFRVTALDDLAAVELQDAAEAFRDDAALADRVLIVLAGHFAHSTRESWLLARDATAPSDLAVGAAGLPLGPLYDIAAEHPGQAVVMLAPSGEEITGPGLATGAALPAPQGVTLISGPADRLAALADGVLLQPGARMREALVPAPAELEVSGFLSDALPFLPAPESAGPMPPPVPADNELAFWNVVVEMATPEAYRAYLGRYPDGRFGAIAQSMIDGAALDAEARAEADEAALGLTRSGRQDVQRNLSLLGHNPHGIDGILGAGSRAAITAWQRANGYDATGYLNATQLRALSEAGEKRAAELAAEAARRKAEEERRDTSYWRDTGRGGGEPGLRAYLDRYPDGLFADIAEARLAEIEAAKRAGAEAAERALWDEARRKDTIDAYREYRDTYPNGLFYEEARARIQAFKAQNRDAARTAAENEEKVVAGNGLMRLLVENRLLAAGQDPGNIDGRFDKTTRRAIRRFQGDQGLEVTGYVTQATMVRLMAVP